jgi:hypothetical protein
VGVETMVVIVGDGAEWIWNRANMFVRRCEILDFWHALEHAWAFARLRYGEGSRQADAWVHGIAEDLRAGQVQEVIAGLKRLRPQTPELRDNLQALIRYYSENAGRMRYDEYLRLGYGIGSGAVESAHKQVVHARFRQAGMRWSEAGVPPVDRCLALRHDAAMARRATIEIPADLRTRLETARLDLLALFRALDRMDLSPIEIPLRLIRQLFELDADYAEALWALDQPKGALDLRTMLRDTLAALEQRTEACARFRKALPLRAHPRLAQLETSIRHGLNPLDAYNMVPGH